MKAKKEIGFFESIGMTFTRSFWDTCGAVQNIKLDGNECFWDMKVGIKKALKKATEDDLKAQKKAHLTKDEKKVLIDSWQIPWLVSETIRQMFSKNSMQPERVARYRNKDRTAWVFRYTLPPGYRDTDFLNIEPEFYTAVKRRAVSMEIVGEAIELMVSIRKLPDKIEFEWSDELAALCKAAKAKPLFLGYGVSGPVIVDLKLHSMIWGETGAGKTNLMRLIITVLLLSQPDIEVYVIDRNAGKDYSFCRNHVRRLLETDEIVSELDGLIDEMHRRYKQYDKMNVEDVYVYNSIRPEDKQPLIVVVVDEFADVCDSKDAASRIDTLVRKGRAAGISIISCSQRITRDVTEKMGSIKLNSPAKIAFPLDVTNSTLFLGCDRATRLEHIPGRAVLKDGPYKYTEFQIPNITVKAATKLLESVPTKGVTTNENRKPQAVLPPPRQRFS